MPTYDYYCPGCGQTLERQVDYDLRDEKTSYCSKAGETVLLKRLPAAPNFTVKGYAARNGYSTK